MQFVSRKRRLIGPVSGLGKCLYSGEGNLNIWGEAEKMAVLKRFIFLCTSVETEDSELFEKTKKEALKKSLNPCGFLLHPGFGYASLAPVSQTVIACK